MVVKMALAKYPTTFCSKETVLDPVRFGVDLVRRCRAAWFAPEAANVLGPTFRRVSSLK